MQKYESTITKHIIENPILLPDNFLKIFNEFEIEEKNKISNSNNHNNKKSNTNFIQNHNNNQNDEKFISFGKNLINNGDLSPILSSDSQKNKYSSNSSDKYQDNFPSPIPKGNTIIPSLKVSNNNTSEKIEIPPLLQKNNFNDIKLEVPYKEIKFINQDKNKNSKNNWKRLKESLILQNLLENKINNSNNNSNFLNSVPKNVIVKLLIFSKKNDLFNENNTNTNNINNNDISTDIKISNELTTKIEASTRIILTNNSIDEFIDNSNLYYIDKENFEEQPHQYEPTNIQKILNTNMDTILDNCKFESTINELEHLNLQNNDKFIQGKEKEEYNDNNIISTSKVFIYPIKEVDEDKYEHESKYSSMKNFSFGNNLNLNKVKESQDNLDHFNNNKDIKNEKLTLNPFLVSNNNIDNDYKIENDPNKEKKIEIKDYSEFFRPQKNNLNNIELKINNIDNNNDNINNNYKENKTEFLFEHILNKQLKNSQDNNNNNKDNLNILFNEPYKNFSFGKSDFNNNIKKNESQNEKSDSNQNGNKQIENNIIVTFDKSKNEKENEKNIKVSQFDSIKNDEKNDINNDTNKIENFETEKLIDNKDNNNMDINDKDNNNKDINEIDIQFYSFRPNKEKIDEIKESTKANPHDKEETIIREFPSSKKNENEIDNLNKNNQIKNNSFENLIEISNIKNEENMKYDKNNNDNNSKKEELEIKIVKDDIIDKENNINIDENKINNSIKLSNNEDKTNTHSYKEKENNKKIIEEKIILNNSDCKDENDFKKIDYNKYINSPEVFSSIKSKSINLNNNISIRTNLFNIKPKIITNLQIKNIQKLYPKFNIVINDKNINQDFLKYYLNDFNCIFFANNINDLNKNKYKIKLKSYFNILKKINEKIFYFHDSTIEILINATFERINLIKQKNNIKKIPLLSNSNNIIINDKNDEAMEKVFSDLNSKLKDIKNYYQNINNKNKANNNIVKLRNEFKEAFSKAIRYINKKYEETPIIQIKFYHKVINDLRSFCPKENNGNISKKNKNKSKIIQKGENSNSKKENSLFIQNPLFIVGIIFLIFCFLIKFFY